ncbi:MAG: helix-turn-helix domain-containing protein [Candidatus Gracilibacteria bacterium]
MLQKILENIGLTNKEAKIYLSILSLGSSPVSKIAKKAGLNRVTAYDILEKLMQKGFITKHNRKDSLYFDAVDPEIIALDFRARARDLRKSLPDFKLLKGESTYPQLQYFEGIESIKKIYLDTLNSKTEILNYVDSRSIRLTWPEYDREYVEERVKRKIYLRGISANDEEGKRVKADDWNCYREIRLIDKDAFDFSNEINIYDNKIAIISFSPKPTGMIIENESIVKTQRAIFKMAWEFAGR